MSFDQNDEVLQESKIKNHAINNDNDNDNDNDNNNHDNNDEDDNNNNETTNDNPDPKNKIIDDNASEATDVDSDGKKKMRTIGRWYIGDTLGKGGYSWVKKGFDKKTGKCVALKFMAKADETWQQEQSKQVVAEIEGLKKIRHPNVMKLYAYNLNAKYPTKGKEKVDTILLVLEYAPGGELFDILYYTSALESIVARTYFRQMIAGLEACHNAGVAHRDIKPQNLLLDSRFNLKITDFGLSKVFESDADAIMKTTYVGTRGYQAPELLLEQPYDLSCDIFSAGVVLFILLTGYPPFEQAHASDRWFKPVAKGDYEKFWKSHRGCAIANDAKAKDLLQRMFTFDPKKRITINEIKKHPWYLDKILEGKDLIRALRNRHKEMEAKRRKDARKIDDLQHSIKVSRHLPCPLCSSQGLNCQCFEIQLFPENEVESVVDTHTTANWQDIVNTITEAIGKDGHVSIYPKECKLVCTLKTVTDFQDAQVIKVEIQIYKSREYQKSLLSTNINNDNNDEIVYVVRLRRVEGDLIEYRKVKKYIFNRCAEVLTGLPDWALQLQEQKLARNDKNGKYNDNNYDDYDDILNNPDENESDLENFEDDLDVDNQESSFVVA